MSTLKQLVESQRGEMVHRHSHRWAVPMVIGILLMAVGIFAMCAAVLTSLVSVVYLGVLLLMVGIMEMVAAFRVGRSGPFAAYFLAGLLSLVVGAMFLCRPIASLESLTLLIAGYLFASGLFRGITALADRHAHWGWDLVCGAVAVVLGMVVVAGWPFSSFWVLGAVVAGEIIARGIALVAASRVLRRLSLQDASGSCAAAQ